MNKLINLTTDFKNKCYQGKLINKKITSNGHNLLTLEDLRFVKQEHTYIVTKPIKYNNMNFLVPKRRNRVFQFSKSLNTNSIIRLLLREESRSKKWTVAEIEII